MGAAEAARQAAGIAAAKEPALYFAFAAFYDNFRFIIAAELYLAVSLYRYLAAAYSCIIVV